MKKVFILWSGGLDSTYLIYKNLEEGNIVYSGYISLTNNDPKPDMELKAIYNLKEIFINDYGTIFNFDEILDISIKNSDDLAVLPQYPSWFVGLIYGVKRDIDEIQIGYVMNDDAISYIEDMKKLWNSWKPFYEPLEKFPELVFPLSKIKKECFINELPEKYKNHVVWCEFPVLKNNNYYPCETCHPCKIYKDILPEIFEIKNKRSFLKKCIDYNNSKNKLVKESM